MLGLVLVGFWGKFRSAPAWKELAGPKPPLLVQGASHPIRAHFPLISPSFILHGLLRSPTSG